MERLLRAELRTATLRPFGSPGAGCISEGRAYDTDAGPVFVKVNYRAQVGTQGARGTRGSAGPAGALVRPHSGLRGLAWGSAGLPRRAQAGSGAPRSAGRGGQPVQESEQTFPSLLSGLPGVSAVHPTPGRPPDSTPGKLHSPLPASPPRAQLAADVSPPKSRLSPGFSLPHRRPKLPIVGTQKWRSPA